jgi:hypothetical protein
MLVWLVGVGYESRNSFYESLVVFIPCTLPTIIATIPTCSGVAYAPSSSTTRFAQHTISIITSPRSCAMLASLGARSSHQNRRSFTSFTLASLSPQRPLGTSLSQMPRLWFVRSATSVFLRNADHEFWLPTLADLGDLSWCQFVPNFVEPLRVRKRLVKFRTVAL